MGKSFANIAKTTVLFGVLWGVLLAVGYLIGQGTYLWLFALIGLVGTFISFWNSDTIALRSMHAREVTSQEAPGLFRMVQDLSDSAGQPMPRLYISPTAQPNAFATGRSPKHAAVCVTEGILQLLDERELRGVVGHELMHVYNRDILTSSVAAGMAGIITSLAQLALWFGGGRDRNGGGIIGALLAMILAPLAASLIQLAISRTREYDADHDGANLTQDPLALASALAKISRGVDSHPLPADQNVQDSAHMMIENPFRKGGGLQSMFSTHPPTEQRIARLQRQAQELGRA
jgi:heat shock protein HtpX